MREVAAKSLVGMPVYSLSDGEALGAVKQLIIDPAQKQLLALAVDKKGWYKDIRIIPAEKIHNIGADAITVNERSAATRAANLPQLVKYLNRPNNLIGNRLISDDGQTLGKVEEYYLNADDKQICRLDVNSNRNGEAISGRAAVPGQYIISIGSAAIIIDRAALDSIEPLTSQAKTPNSAANLAGKLAETLANAKKFGIGNKQDYDKNSKSSENSESKISSRLQALTQNMQKEENHKTEAPTGSIPDNCNATSQEPIAEPIEAPNNEPEQTAQQ